MYRRRWAVIGVIVAMIGVACAPPLASTPGSSAGTSVGPTAAASGASGTGPDGVALIDLSGADAPGAAAEHEIDLHRDVRDDAGMPALIGADGAATFAALETIEADYGRRLIADVARQLDAGEIPGSAALSDQVASIGGDLPPPPRAADAIDLNVFAETGFTATALMGMFTSIVAQASEAGSGTLPGQQRFDQTSDGLRQQGVLHTTISAATGGGKVSVDIILDATDNISNASTGAFVALYTSRSTGHFDVDACPDEAGVAAGTYTFETRHELNDVSGATASRSGGGRSVEAPFRLIDGEDAHLLEIQASLGLGGDAHGPGTAGGPGPTGPFDWQAAQQVQVVMSARGGTTGTGSGLSVTGTGGEVAGGMMFFSSAMAQLFMKEVGKEAERFWRSGECVDLVPSRESGKVDPNEQVELTVQAKEALGGGGEIDAPIVATFTGKTSLEPAGVPVDKPFRFTFKAGAEPEDKGTIELEQISVRGIGRTTVEFTVGAPDFRVTVMTAAGGLTATKCHGHEGRWTISSSGRGTAGTMTFTFAEGSTSAEVHAIYDIEAGGSTAHWDMRGPVTFVDGDPALLRFGKLAGTATVKGLGQSVTAPVSQPIFATPLESGQFCN